MSSFARRVPLNRNCRSYDSNVSFAMAASYSSVVQRAGVEVRLLSFREFEEADELRAGAPQLHHVAVRVPRRRPDVRERAVDAHLGRPAGRLLRRADRAAGENEDGGEDEDAPVAAALNS